VKFVTLITGKARVLRWLGSSHFDVCRVPAFDLMLVMTDYGVQDSIDVLVLLHGRLY
jgi:hypothetical protein